MRSHRVQKGGFLVTHRGHHEAVTAKAIQHRGAKATCARFHDPELVHNDDAACWDAAKVVYGAVKGFGEAGGVVVDTSADKVVLRVSTFAGNAVDVHGLGAAHLGGRLLLGQEAIHRQGDSFQESPYESGFADTVASNNQNMNSDPPKIRVKAGRKHTNRQTSCSIASCM